MSVFGYGSTYVQGPQPRPMTFQSPSNGMQQSMSSGISQEDLRAIPTAQSQNNPMAAPTSAPRYSAPNVFNRTFDSTNVAPIDASQALRRRMPTSSSSEQKWADAYLNAGRATRNEDGTVDALTFDQKNPFSEIYKSFDAANKTRQGYDYDRVTPYSGDPTFRNAQKVLDSVNNIDSSNLAQLAYGKNIPKMFDSSYNTMASIYKNPEALRQFNQYQSFGGEFNSQERVFQEAYNKLMSRMDERYLL